MTPMHRVHKSAGLAALAASAAFAMSTPSAKAACNGPANVCSSFDPSTLTQIVDAPLTGTITASGGANNQLDTMGVQFNWGPTANSFNYQFTIQNVIVKNFPIGNSGLKQPSFNFGSITFNSWNDAGNTLPSPLGLLSAFTGGGNITSNINFLAAGTTISFDIPAGVANSGAQLDVNLIYGKTGSGSDATSAIFSTTAAVPGPLPILGAASAFGFSRSIRRRIKLAKVS